MLRHQSDSGASKGYMSEVTGPILPHSLHGIMHLYANTQQQYTVTLSCHDTTAPLNAGPVTNTRTPQVIATLLQESSVLFST